jgi:hypothetical protein
MVNPKSIQINDCNTVLSYNALKSRSLILEESSEGSINGDSTVFAYSHKYLLDTKGVAIIEATSRSNSTVRDATRITGLVHTPAVYNTQL